MLLECGGKRSRGPQRGSSAGVVGARHRFGFKQLDLSRDISAKAPSPLRSAGALQNGALTIVTCSQAGAKANAPIVAAGKLIHQQQSRTEEITMANQCFALATVKWPPD